MVWDVAEVVEADVVVAAALPAKMDPMRKTFVRRTVNWYKRRVCSAKAQAKQKFEKHLVILMKVHFLCTPHTFDVFLFSVRTVFDRNNGGGGGGGASDNSLRRPTLKREKKIDPEIERKQIQDVLGNDNDDDDDDGGDAELTAGMKGLANDAFRPIELQQITSYGLVKNEIKNEQTDLPPPPSDGAASAEYPQSLKDFFTRTGPQLFLLQLPDSLPGHGPDMEPGESAAAEQNNKSDDPVSCDFIFVLSFFFIFFFFFSLVV